MAAPQASRLASQMQISHAILANSEVVNLKVTTEKLEKSQVALQVEVEPEILEQTLQRAYRRLVNRTQIQASARERPRERC